MMASTIDQTVGLLLWQKRERSSGATPVEIEMLVLQGDINVMDLSLCLDSAISQPHGIRYNPRKYYAYRQKQMQMIVVN